MGKGIAAPRPMSEFNVFMTEEETNAVWASLFKDEAAVAFPDRSATVTIPLFRSLSELRSHASSPDVHQYFVASAKWGDYVPCLGSEQAPGAYPFRLTPQYGGPHLIWTLSRCWERNGVTWLVPASLVDYSSYYGPGGHDVVDRPRSLQASFSRLKSMLREGSVPSRADGGFAGPIISSGARLVHSRGGWLRVGSVRFEPHKT